MRLRAGCAALVITLLVAGPAAGTVSLRATFVGPAQAEGELASSGLQWALLVFRQAPETTFDLELNAPGRITNHTQIWQEQNTPLSRGRAPYPIPDRSSDLAQDLDGQLTFDAHPWSSLYIEAETISIHTEQAQATVRTVTSQDWADRHVPNREIPASHLRTMKTKTARIARV